MALLMSPKGYCLCNRIRFKAVIDIASCKESVRPKSIRSYPTNKNLEVFEPDLLYLKPSNASTQLQLKFTECVMGLKSYHTIPLPFEETERDTLRMKIQHNYNEIKIQYNACQVRLDQVLGEVGNRNPALFALLDQVPSKKQLIVTQHKVPQINDTLSGALMPQRDVYTMKIPIQSDRGKVSLSTKERYKAQYIIYKGL
jgi:hypothetical protein